MAVSIMKKTYIKPILLCLTLASTLVFLGCSSRPVYSPAAESGKVGFYESKLTSDRYRVSFVGYPSTTGDEVQNFVLLRAAELTLQNNFEWFEIINRTLTEKTHNSDPTFTIGLSSSCYPFGCSGLGSRWYTGMRVDGDGYSDRYKASIEIRMGNGETEDEKTIYNAKELVENLSVFVEETSVDTSDK